MRREAAEHAVGYGSAALWGASVGAIYVTVGLSQSTAEAHLWVQYWLVAVSLAAPLGACIGAFSFFVAKRIWRGLFKARSLPVAMSAAAAGPIVVGSLVALFLALTVFPGLLHFVWIPILGSIVGGVSTAAFLRRRSKSREEAALLRERTEVV